MRIAVVHNAVSADSAPDEQDVIAQADAVTDVLRQLDHKPVRLTCGLNLSRVKSELGAVGPQMVFNLSLLESPDGPQILPPAEIIFEGFEAGRARIVDYQAKWDPDSYAYHHTPRRFDFDAADEGLLEDLRGLSRECWDLFGLRGYARVDFRVDLQGRPWILEINANPCLSPDAGFAAAVHRAGLSLTEAVGRMVEAGRQPALSGDR